MNDFKKEELKLLFGGLQLWMEEILYEDEHDQSFRNELYKKIQSMINNYCEHEKSHIPSIMATNNGLIVGHSCIKCGEFCK